ncbi:MAG: hypothetical protein WCB68_14305 [Pyrinomonadaceae bacterium]
MNKTRFTLNLIAAFALFIAGSSLAHAQATRTWVSGVGNDADPCSRTAPCKTFSGALSKTAEGGEIDALDPAGYGTVSLNKSITIDGGTGSGWGSVLNSGTNGITVNVTVNAATSVVVLRNLTINGAKNCVTAGCAGLIGIRFIAGNALHVEDVVIENQATTGIDINKTTTGQLWVRDTAFTNTTVGIRSTTSSGVIISQVEHCRFAQLTDGVNAISNTFATIRDSYFGGTTGAVNGAVRAGTGSTINIENSMFANNAIGVNVSTGTVRLSNNDFFNNTTAISGTAESANNNKFRGNSADGTTSNVIVVK